MSWSQENQTSTGKPQPESSSASEQSGRDAVACPGAEAGGPNPATIIESSQDAIISKDLTGKITSWNAAAEQLFGYRAEEMLGQSVARLIPPELQAEEAAILGRLQRGERVTRFESVRVAKDGRRIPVSLTLSPMRDSAGAVVGASKIVRDITERKQTEEALRQSEMLFRTAFESGAVAMALTSLEGTLLKVNPVFCRMLGYSEAELTGHSFAKVTHPEDVAESLRGARQMCNGKTSAFRMEKRYVRKNGTVIWGDMGTATVCNSQGAPLYYVTHVQDITERKHAEEALARAKAELEHSNQELEQRVKDRTAELERALAEMEHFSYAIAHDLRGPMRALQGYAHLAAHEMKSSPSSKALDYLQRIKTASERMDALIRDSLSYSKAVREKLPLEAVELGKLLQAVLETYPQFHSERAEVRIDGSLPPVWGNETALGQCFSNLLDNAVKFAKPGTKPQIRLWAEERTNPVSSVGSAQPSFSPPPALLPSAQADTSLQPTLRIWVEDNGLGIPHEAQQRIFGLFQRATNNHEGTGIGLAIVRKVVHQMGGEVGVESEPGQGSRFWVELRKAA